MSRTVFIDGRMVEVSNCHGIIQAAMRELGARRSEANCGRATVLESQIDVSAPVEAFNRARFQDQVETQDTGALQARLTQDGPDYCAEALGDWRPDLSAPPIDVDDVGSLERGGRRLVEMFDVPMLDDPAAGVVGATISVLEVEDGKGGTSYEIGLDKCLFDDQGEWKSNAARKRWEQFLLRQNEEQRASTRPASDPPSPRRAEAAMKAAGLLEKRRSGAGKGRSHSVFEAPRRGERETPRTTHATATPPLKR